MALNTSSHWENFSWTGFSSASVSRRRSGRWPAAVWSKSRPTNWWELLGFGCWMDSEAPAQRCQGFWWILRLNKTGPYLLTCSVASESAPHRNTSWEEGHFQRTWESKTGSVLRKSRSPHLIYLKQNYSFYILLVHIPEKRGKINREM